MADDSGGVWVLEANSPPCMGAQLPSSSPSAAPSAELLATPTPHKDEEVAVNDEPQAVPGGTAPSAAVDCDSLHDAYLEDLMRTFVLPYLERRESPGEGKEPSASGSLWYPAHGKLEARPASRQRRASLELELQLFMRHDARCR